MVSFRHQNEFSVDVESEFFIETLGWTLLNLIGVDDSPLLVDSTVFLIWDNVSSFQVFAAINVEDSVVSNISNEGTVILVVSKMNVSTDTAE